MEYLLRQKTVVPGAERVQVFDAGQSLRGAGMASRVHVRIEQSVVIRSRGQRMRL